MATSKRKGIKSSAQDNFLEPNAVINLTATDVGTNRAYNDGAVNLSWDLPAASPPATLYTITTSPTTTTQTTANKTFLFQGLASGTAYTFTVIASNAAGNSLPATASATATTVPSSPRNASASSPSNNSDRVVWDAPASDGGKAVSSYTVVSTDGPSYTNSVSPKDIPETGNTTQSYTIYALNANGTSLGTSTNSVTTFTPPYFPPFFPPHFPPFFPPFFPPYFPPFFPPHFPPFFPPYFAFTPPYFPPYFSGYPYFAFTPPYFPPYFAPPRFGFRY